MPVRKVYSWGTVRRAAGSSGVVKEKTGGRGKGWEWSLPKGDGSKMLTPIHSELNTLSTFDNHVENKGDDTATNSKMLTTTYMSTFEEGEA